MRADQIKSFKSYILATDEVHQVQDVSIEGGVVYLSTWNITAHKIDSLELWKTDNVILCTREGILTEGRTDAEINARRYAEKFDLFAKFTATVEVKTSIQGTMATVTIRENEIGGQSISATWLTYTRKGRTYTTLLTAIHIRSIWHTKRQKSVVKLTLAAFKREVNWFLTLAQLDAQRTADKNA